MCPQIVKFLDGTSQDVIIKLRKIVDPDSKYLSDDGNLDNTTTGEIKLKTLNNCNNKSWQFNISSDYTYDNNKIEVTSGVARLKNMTTGIDSNTKALWHLDETSGDIIDYSGTGNNLSNVTGSPAYNQSGKFNTSLQFNLIFNILFDKSFNSFIEIDNLFDINIFLL
mgnify:CR=1 FL=1